jgi:hypothetical protein
MYIMYIIYIPLCLNMCTVHVYTLNAPNTEYTECWPCPLFDILLNKYYPAG